MWRKFGALNLHMEPARLSCALFALALFFPSEGSAVTGDLNFDGRVDFDDFFLFADHFGLEGPPERDTLIVTTVDTLFLQGPIPSEGPFPTEEAGLIDGYWLADVRHDAYTLQLGPDLELERHRIMRVTNVSDGSIHDRWYLKPTGHLIAEESRPYSTISMGGAYGFYGNFRSGSATRYHYDAELKVVEIEAKSTREARTWSGSQYISICCPGVFTVLPAGEGRENYLTFSQINDDEAYIYADTQRDWVEAWTPSEDWRWTRSEINWDTELAK